MTAPTAPPAPPVLVRVPVALGPVEVLVQHQPWGEVTVDVRPSGSAQVWQPLTSLGGEFVVRAS